MMSSILYTTLAELCIVCYTTGYMSEVRNVIILILVLLFIFVGVGVAISRLGKSVKTDGSSDIGFLQRVYYDIFEPVATPSAKTKKVGTNQVTPMPGQPTTTVNPKSGSTTPAGDKTYTFAQVTGTPTNPNQMSLITPTSSPIAVSEQKGGNAEQIPATGAPTWILIAALGSLAAGLRLSKRA